MPDRGDGPIRVQDGNPPSEQSRTQPRSSDRAARSPAPVSVCTRQTLPATAKAPGIARRLLAEHTEFLSAEMRDDAKLLLSELVTNALLHGSPVITIALTTSADGVRLEVHDTSHAFPDRPPHNPGPCQATGRGLLLIDALSSGWGVTATENYPGKTVWTELWTAGGRTPSPRPDQDAAEPPPLTEPADGLSTLSLRVRGVERI